MKRAILLLISLWFIGSSLYAQCVAGNCKNGKGTYIYKDKTVYEGAFKDTKAHGFGICFYANGNSYEGEWANHTFHGKGIMRYKNGKVKAGVWKKGKFTKALNINTIAPPKSMAFYDNIEKTEEKGQNNTTKIWAVIVGVAAYTHMPMLNFTDDDAYRMFAFLKSPEGGALPDPQIKIIVDEGATRKNILKIMRNTFNQADTNDVILFYFSGHGLQNAFLPIDYDGHLNRLKHNEIKQIFAESKAKHKICIADACHSGSFEAQTKNPYNSTIQKYYDAFNESKGGTALILSSKAEEVSIENAGLRQGIFTHFLIRGLKGLADKNKDMIITIVELFEYVKESVKFYTGNYQTPVLYGEFDKRMPISVVRE